MPSDTEVDSIHLLRQRSDLWFNPAPLRIYKPQQNGKGTALQVDLRLDPEYDKGYIKKVQGGLFVELVPQAGKNDQGNATFDWNAGIKAKFGSADIAAFLLGFRYTRIRRVPIPQELRTKGDTIGDSIGRFHRFGNDTTVISLKFGGDGSFLRISKSATEWRSIKLSLTEEFLVERMLLRALDAFQQVGK